MKIFIVFFLAISGNIMFASNCSCMSLEPAIRSVSGKTIDKNSGEIISGATIVVGGKIYYSDLNGEFNIELSAPNATASVSFISYSAVTIEINMYSYSAIVVELEPE